MKPRLNTCLLFCAVYFLASNLHAAIIDDGLPPGPTGPAWTYGSSFSGNGELLLVAWNETTQTSVAQDIGIRFNNFDRNNQNYTFALSNTFNFYFGNNLSKTKYALVLGNAGSSLPSGRGVLITSNSTNPSLSLTDYFSFSATMSSQVAPRVNGSNTNFAQHPTTVGSLGSFSSVNRYRYLGTSTVFGEFAAGSTNFNISANVEDPLNMWFFGFSPGSPAPTAEGHWDLDISNGLLTWDPTPVPLPASAWLFLSGGLFFSLIKVKQRRQA